MPWCLQAGEETEQTPEMPRGSSCCRPRMTWVSEAWMVGRYYTRQGHLHGDCFYAGLCEPIGGTEHRIRMTSDYIDDAARLASA